MVKQFREEVLKTILQILGSWYTSQDYQAISLKNGGVFYCLKMERLTEDYFLREKHVSIHLNV